MKKIIILSSIFFFSMMSFGKSYGNTSEMKEIIIYWDASLSLKNRDIVKEVEFLDSFFDLYPNSEVKLIVFNTSRISEDSFTIKSSNWDLLMEKINNIQYDGASNFNLVDIGGSEDLLLFFTDGRNNFGSIDKKLYTPRIITISSVKDINRKFLHQTAYYNTGYYLNLLESDVAFSINAIKEKQVMSKLVFVDNKKENIDTSYLEGLVTDTKGNPLSDVRVNIKDKKVSTITDENGAYIVDVNPTDVLIFSYANMKTVEVVVGKENLIDIKLTENVNDLAPVIIKSNQKGGTEMVRMGDRFVSRRSLGYAVNNTTEEDVSDADRTLGESMAGNFAGVQMGNHNDASQTIIRGFSSLLLTNHPVFIIDGVPLKQSGVGIETKVDMSFIDPNIIKDITVLKGLAATNRYGVLGNNGIVLITTKMADLELAEKEENAKKEKEIEYSVYTSPLVLLEEEDSNFVTMLKSFSNTNDAYTHYLNQINANVNNITYFTESASYFFDKNDSEKGMRVLSNLLELFPRDTSVLKLLAFNLEKYNLYETAEKIYERIVEISPTLSQNYLDLANNYFDNKKFQSSVNLFQKISENKINSVLSFDGLNSQISNDFKSLLSNRNQTWKIKNVKQSNFLLPKYKLRVVTEWSHPQTEFEIQYINPKKQYFNLSHTKEKNDFVLRKELKEGFLSDEYILSDLELGDWFLNLIIPETYVHNMKYPHYLKVKIYTQFGTSNQKLQTHLINLDSVKNNKIFATFTVQ